MPHVITEKCIDCRNTECVEVCPVDAFKTNDRMLIIDPTICIDCDACTYECPVDAIVTDNSPHPRLDEYIEYAEQAAKLWPAITKKQKPLSTTTDTSIDKWLIKPQLEEQK